MTPAEQLLMNGCCPKAWLPCLRRPEGRLKSSAPLGGVRTAKFETMRDWAGPDGRVRGGLLYHGATTGRWSGAGVQPQNFPKGTIKHLDIEAAWTLLKTGDRSQILARYPSVMEVLSCALRGAIVAAAGHQLYVADYASIEARVLLWLAGEQDALRLFREGGDIYCDMASTIYDRPITKADNQERQLGKAAILGAGFGMGAAKFQVTAAAAPYFVTIDEEFSQQTIDAYRQKYWRVKQLWYDTEAAACEAVTHKGHLIRHDRTAWQRMGRFLYCTLPSGRRLAYPEPELRKRQTPWGAEKWALTYKGVNTYTRQWERQTSYGGLLVENQVQGIARDIMAAALQRIEESGTYVPVLGVHDEALAEAPIGQGSVAEFENLLTMSTEVGGRMPD
jgi:DNA polymerase